MMYRSRDDKEGTIVYVGGLLAEVKKEDIESEFEKFGKLLRVWVAFNPPGFAFVEFSSKEDAETAVNALHNATILGSKLRVEISRGRGKGGRGGRGSDRGSRGGFRGGRGPEFSRGRGLSRGGFGGRPSPYDRNGDLRGRGGMGGRFDDYEDRRREFDERPLGARRDRDFGDIDPPRFGGSRDFRDIGGLRGYGDRDIGGRDFPSRDIGGRDFPARDIGGRDFAPRDIGGIPPRDIEERDFIPRNFSRDFGEGREGRDLRDFGADRDVNGMRGFGGNPRELGSGRDYPVSQAPIPGRDFGAPGRDIGGGRNFGARDIDDIRDYSGNRDIGMRRDAVRDFNQPRDIDNSRDFGGGMPARVIDYGEPERFGAGGGRGGFGDRGGQRPGGFDAGRFSGGDIGGSGNYDGYNARDRFRSRSPIGRGRPMY